MVRTRALMECVSANLHEFLHSIDTDLTVPQKKFLRDGLLGLLRAGRPIVCRMARKLPDQRTKFLSRLDRMEGNLNRQSDLDDKLKAALPDPRPTRPCCRREEGQIQDREEMDIGSRAVVGVCGGSWTIGQLRPCFCFLTCN